MTLDQNTQVSAFAPASTNKTFEIGSHFNIADIKLYFERVLGKKQLNDDETIRITFDSYSWSDTLKDYDIGGVLTSKEQLKSVDEVINFMALHTCPENRTGKDKRNISDELKNKLGYSISASTYKYIGPDENGNLNAPGLATMISTQTFVLDLDARVSSERTSARYAFNNATLETKQAAAGYLIGLINTMLTDNNSMDWYLVPSYVYETGGGLQFLFKFTNNLSKDDATQIYTTLKHTLEDVLEKYKNSFKFYMQDILGVRPVYFEIDFSTFDVTHTQRIGGTRNPKKMYAGAMAKELPLNFKNREDITTIIENYSDAFKNNSEELYLEYKANFDYRMMGAITPEAKAEIGLMIDKATYDDRIIKYSSALILNSYNFYIKATHHYNKIYYSQIPREDYATYVNTFNMLVEAKAQNKQVDQFVYEYYDMLLQNLYIPSESLLVDCKLITNKHTSENSVNSNIMDPANIGVYELLSKLTPYQQLQIFKSKLKGEVTGSKYNKYLCPFHEETNTPSLAIYHLGATSPKNDVPANKNLYVYDYHDGKSYDVVTFIEALYLKERGEPVARGTILNEIALDYNITLTKSDRKLFNEAETASKVEDLIALIDTDNYMYYRKANKSKDCIIREFEDGTYVTFDGTKMMAEHVLESYLKVQNVNHEFKNSFHDIFCNKILKNRFEKFKPNYPHEFVERKNSYVNLWVPGKAYKEVHEMAEDIPFMDISTAIELIKVTLPTSWIFLNQLTQKGSLEYFVNWLACVAQYKVMPTLPIITSVQGTGKNVFVREWLEYYLNNEYVNIATSEKIQSNFNAFMETSSMIVLDEGDFSRSKEVDQLKYLTGNDKVTVEKKGVDSQQLQRYFNMIMLTNGECPMMHTYDDRRVTYFRLEVKLLTTVLEAGFASIEDFIETLRTEVTMFWAILVKTKIEHKWSHNNLQDNVFNKQLLMMHPFGKLVTKIIEGDWDTIEFQLNENVQDRTVMANNNDMINEIKNNYHNAGMISMDLINKYIHSLNYKSHRNVIEYINANQLHRFGIEVIKHDGFMKMKIDKTKIIEKTTIDNNIGKLFEKFNSDNINDTLNLKRSHDSDEANSGNLSTNNAPGIYSNLSSTANSNPLGIPLNLGSLTPPALNNIDNNLM